MGVSGSGKTTTGKLLAQKTGWPFYDADDFHPTQNITKMKAGIPLTDDDRWPWLDSMNAFSKRALSSTNLVITCSALKEVYRIRLTKDIEQHCCWVYLKGNEELIAKRMMQRKEHFMPTALLQSQLKLLEEPEGAVEVDISLPPEKIVEHIMQHLQ